MTSLPLYDSAGKSMGTIDATDNVFGIEVKESLLHEAVKWLLSGQRQGTSSSKTRAEVRGGGKKPWKQKGTGRARAGTIRSPLWRGGGVIFGPKPRDYSFNMPKKARKVAIAMALADKVKSEKVKVVENIALKEAKTKNMVKVLAKLKINNVLMMLDSATAAEKRAAGNIEKVKLINSKDATVFDILKYEWLLLDRAAISNIEERFKG